jgi:hypothetical protein
MLFIYDNSLKIWHCFCAIFTMFPIRFFYNKACNWSIGFLQIVNISKLYHILESNHSTFYVWNFQVSFPYKFLVLKMRTLLFTKYMWRTITFHCLPSSRWYNEIHIIRPFSYNQNGILKENCIENLNGKHILWYILYIKISFLEKHQNFNLWWYFKIPLHKSLWANFG